MNDDARLAAAREHFLAGVADLEAGRLDAAQARFEQALALVPGRPSVLVNLGHVARRRGDAAGALSMFEQATAAAPDDAEAWTLRGQALQALERHAEALPCYERACRLDPRIALAWTNRAALLADTGRRDEAIACWRKALAHGGDAELIRHALAALTGESTPSAPPRRYVRGLFDDYAASFDAHLVGRLGYRAPAELVEGARILAGGRRFASVLELGCGTGLAGPLLRPLADRLEGVDLSPGMLAKARERGDYDALAEADVAEHLAATPPATHDLVLAADVFIYVGALDAVFAGVTRALTPGGLFAFTAEPCDDGRDLALLPSQRYAHSERSLRALADAHGLRVARLERAPIREEQRRTVDALYAWMRRAPA